MAINGQSCARRRPGYRGTCRVFATSKGARLVGGKRARPSQHSDRASKMARMSMAHLRILLEGSRPLEDSVDEVIRSHKMFLFLFLFEQRHCGVHTVIVSAGGLVRCPCLCSHVKAHTKARVRVQGTWSFEEKLLSRLLLVLREWKNDRN